MKTKINNKLIRSFNPCYDPSEIGIPDNESLKIKDWIEKYRNQVQDKADIIWLVCRKEFMTDKDLRLFAIWCAREALKLVENPDQRSINACNIAEKFANGQTTQEELNAARAAAWAPAWASDSAAAWAPAWASDSVAASAAVWASAWASACNAQIDKLLTYFK